MAVSVTGPRAVNELGGPVIPGRRHTTYYTGRRLPWTMITTSNTAVMTISTFAHLKFRLYCFYSSNKWNWYSNIKGVY